MSVFATVGFSEATFLCTYVQSMFQELPSSLCFSVTGAGQ